MPIQRLKPPSIINSIFECQIFSFLSKDDIKNQVVIMLEMSCDKNGSWVIEKVERWKVKKH